MPTPFPAPTELPPPHGVTFTRYGAEASVYARSADAVELCLFDEDDRTGASERRVPLTQRAHGTWFDHIDGVAPGQRYGYRVHGAWDPDRGLRHNPAKLLVDPYALGVEGDVVWRPEVFGHTVDDRLRGDTGVRDDRDSAPYVPRSVMLDRTFDWGDDAAPRVPLSHTVLYEAHVRSLTRRLPGVPAPLRGTYAAMGHPVVVDHLQRLGVTSVELLPIHSFVSEPRLVRQGLVNHWGYNSLAFLAPHAGYAAARTPQGVLDEVKTMVKNLHAAGIEVLLDVVYNHTGEQGVDGATLAYRGLDAPAYYRLDGRGRDIDVTGCGNTVDLNQTPAIRLVLDSLRYWVQDVHVDGFRFDLAVALGRGRDDGFDPHHPFFVALRTDPVLSRVKLVAEPWDVGFNGWRTGQFPPPFSEWNDRFRDTARTFWLTDVAAAAHGGGGGHGVSALASALTGTQELFDNRDRDTNASINFVTAHDGFTLADLTTYDAKHNEANGEDNRDGTSDNRSWNHGVEGPAGPGTQAQRARSMRNLLATLLLSAGVPMITAGDEIGRTQHGNNNPYCQDNAVSWIDWELDPWQRDLLATTSFLTRLRQDLPVLRQRPFFGGRDGARGPAVQWFSARGEHMTTAEWDDPATCTLVALLDGTAVEHDSVLLVLRGGHGPGEVVLPDVRGTGSYELVWSSEWERPAGHTRRFLPRTTTTVQAPSVQVFRALP